MNSHGEEPRIKAHERTKLHARSANVIKGRLSKYIRWLNRVLASEHSTTQNGLPETTNIVLNQQNIFQQLRTGVLLCTIVQRLDPSMFNNHNNSYKISTMEL